MTLAKTLPRPLREVEALSGPRSLLKAISEAYQRVEYPKRLREEGLTDLRTMYALFEKTVKNAQIPSVFYRTSFSSSPQPNRGELRGKREKVVRREETGQIGRRIP